MARPRLLVLLFLAGAAVSGFTLLRGIEFFDEGLALQAGRRVADGQLPYRDFLWPYGPGHPYLLAGASELFGDSLLWWRIVRVLCDSGVALLTFVIAIRFMPLRWALAAWLCAACAMAQPVSANPFPVALVAGLGALALYTAPVPRARAWLWAGLLAGVAAAWRLDFAVYASAAVVAAVLLRPGAPVRERVAEAARFAAAASVVAIAAYLPFVIAAGPGDAYDALVGTAPRERGYWTLPFPISYDGRFRVWPPGSLLEDGKDLLGFYVPLLVVVGFAAAVACCAIAWRRRDGEAAPWAPVSLLVLGVGTLSYLLSRTDEFHANPAIVVLALILPAVGTGVWRAGGPGRVVAGAGLAAFGLLLAYGVANRASALVHPQDLRRLDLAVAHGVRAEPRQAQALPPVVRMVQRMVPPGQPIYAATRRSDLVAFNAPLLYVLTQRPNVLDRDVGLFARPSEQRYIVRRLRAARPRAVVRWTSRLSAKREPNKRGKPTGYHLVDDFLARAYRPVARHGDFQVLAPTRP